MRRGEREPPAQRAVARKADIGSSWKSASKQEISESGFMFSSKAKSDSYWALALKRVTILRKTFALLFAVVAAPSLAAPALAADLNDYPTSTRADYVFGCMKANGDTRQSLEQCSCSIDVIATILPYDKYVAAETVASITQQAGQIGGMLRNSAFAQDALDELRRAQAEAQVRCF
jgi:hypothetical protein